ncbi:MAG TPA: Ku protein, partial [Streptosporangiaceae bacterium]|nr:Ku protein [Streptosporangiaceae bacterium]
AGIATFVMHGKEHLVAVRPDGDVLALETMFFADEVRDPRQVIGSLPGKIRSRGQELDIAKQIIESMTTRWRPQSYRDTYREQLSKLIDRKRRGEEIVTEGGAPADSNVVDLMEALRQSADAARGRRGGSRGRSGSGGGGRQRRGGSGGSGGSGRSGRSGSRGAGGSRGRRQAAR